MILPVAAQGGTDFTGFWKVACPQPYGLQIIPASEGEFSVSFCGPGGCFEPGTYRPETPIVGDPAYEVLSPTRIKVWGRFGWSTYRKCTDDPHPELRYGG